MNSVIHLLGAACFIVVAVMTVTGPLLPLIAEEFGRSIGTAGIIVTAFAVPYGAFQVVFGPLGDRVGKLRVIALALGVSTVFTLGCGLAATLEELTWMRFLCGVAMAGTVPLAMAYIADEVPYAERQPVIGRFINGLILGQIAGGTFGGIAAEYFAWRHVFLFFAVLSAGIAVCLWFRSSATRRAAVDAAPTPRPALALYLELLRVPRSRDVILAGLLEGMLIFGILAYFGAFLRHAHGLGYATIGIVLGMYGVGGLIYSAAVYRVVRALGERGMIVGGSLLLAGCYLLITIIETWWLLLPVFALAGFGFYTFHNTIQTQATEMSATARGTAVALWVFVMFGGQGLGVVFGGRLIDAVGYTTTFAGAALGVAALGLWFARRLAPAPP